VDQSYPAIYTNDLFQEVVKQYFTGVSGNVFFKDEFLKDLTMCLNFTGKAFTDLEQSIASVSTPIVLVPNYQYVLMDSLDKNDKMFLDDIFVVSPAITIYKPINDRKLKVNVTGICSLSTNLFRPRLQLRRKAGAISPTSADEILAESFVLTGPGLEKGTLNWSGDLLKGEHLYVSIDVNDISGGSSSGNLNSLTWTIDVEEGAYFGDTYDPKIYLPDITQYDYFQEVVKRFGLIYQINPNDTIRFECFKDVFDGAFGHDDWTDKLSGFKETSFQYGAYGKKSYLQYKGDRLPLLITNYNGWSEVAFDNDNYEAVKIIIQSIGEAISVYNGFLTGFSSVQLANYTDTIPAAPQYPKDRGPVFIQSGIEPALEDFDLYLLRDGIFTGGTGVTLNIGEDMNVSKIQEFVTITASYFGGILTSLERPQVYVMDLNLSIADFYNLDFFKLKYFEQFQSYFYLIKAENFIPGKLTKCTFLKVQRA
jgi:hypothetical protein